MGPQPQRKQHNPRASALQGPLLLHPQRVPLFSAQFP